MKSRLQRSSTALLVAMVGLSLVFSAGCASSKKKKAKEATELPSEKDGEKSPEGDKLTDAGSGDTGSGTSDIGGGKDGSSSGGDNFASNPPPKDDLSPAPGGGAGSFEGLESRHGAPSIGAEDQSLALAPAAPAPADDEAPAPVSKKKTKKGKKGKKKKAHTEAPIETADTDAAPVDDAGGVDGANSYTVKKGDSLSKIAKSHGVKLKSLLTANGMKMEDAAKLKVGAKIKIPGSGKAD